MVVTIRLNLDVELVGALRTYLGKTGCSEKLTNVVEVVLSRYPISNWENVDLKIHATKQFDKVKRHGYYIKISEAADHLFQFWLARGLPVNRLIEKELEKWQNEFEEKELGFGGERIDGS